MRTNYPSILITLSLVCTAAACDATDEPTDPRVACVALSSQCPDDDDDDTGGRDDDGGGRGDDTCGYRTHGQAAWGSACADDDVGCLRDAHFAEVFPEGLYVGCGVLTANLTSSAAVAAALPTGGMARALHPGEAGAYDGDGDPDVKTVFFGEVVALSLNLGFGGVPGFDPGEPGVAFADLVIDDPDSPCHGMTVQGVLDEANLALGDCPAALSPADLNGCVAALNGGDGGPSLLDHNGAPQCAAQDTTTGSGGDPDRD